MSIGLYMDHNVPSAITEGLRHRGVDVVFAYEDGTSEFKDSDLLSRATELGRVLVSMDKHLPAEAVKRQRRGIPFAGVAYAHQTSITFREMIDCLELLAKVYDSDDMFNQLVYLPL